MKSIYIFFSYTYDFIAKCTLEAAAAAELPASSCTYLSTVQFASLSTTSTFTYLGCASSPPGGPGLACSYEASGSYTVVMLVNESTGLKTQILGSDTYAGLGKPLSPPAWGDSRSIYFLADVNYEQGVVRIQTATRTVTVFRFTWVDKFQYFHSLVYLPSRTQFQDAGAQIAAANATSIVVMTGVGFSSRYTFLVVIVFHLVS